MPTYEFRCADCDKTFEITSSFSERDNIVCPFCTGKRLIHIIGKNIWIKYRGKGFTKRVSPNEDE